MKQTKMIMGMPVTVEIVDSSVLKKDMQDVFFYFKKIDERFSPYKVSSEISKINRYEISKKNYSEELVKILKLARVTKKETYGFFDIYFKDKMDPSGIVKGYAIANATKILLKKGFKNFYINAGGDIQTMGSNSKNQKWKVGIKSPFNINQNVKIVNLSGGGIATSGNYERGLHIYNPKTLRFSDDIASITIISKNIYDADRFATAAFAMGEKGIEFIASKKDLEGYMIKKDKTAVLTQGFEKYVS